MLELESCSGRFEENLSKEIHSIVRKRHKTKPKESNGDYLPDYSSIQILSVGKKYDREETLQNQELETGTSIPSLVFFNCLRISFIVP